MNYQVMILENAAFNIVKEFKTVEAAQAFALELEGAVAVFEKIDSFTSVQI